VQWTSREVQWDAETDAKKICTERPKDWDRYINPLLFTYREVPQESLCFAPFAILYVHSVHDPMTILKVLWTKEIPDEEIKSTYQYMLDLRERLQETCKIAHEHLEKARKHQRKHYNKKTQKSSDGTGRQCTCSSPNEI
jgi:hypothetical protein